MFPIICADIFFVSVARCTFAFSSIGMIIARDGASIKCTNDVLRRACKHGTVLLAGSVRAARMMGEISKKQIKNRYILFY